MELVEGEDLSTLITRETRFTFDPGPDEFPIWSADGARIVFRTGSLVRHASIGTCRMISYWLDALFVIRFTTLRRDL